MIGCSVPTPAGLPPELDSNVAEGGNGRAARFILIVEDDPLLAAFYRSSFSRDRVKIAASTGEALGWMYQERPDVLIIDYARQYSMANEPLSQAVSLPLTVVVSGNPLASVFARRIGAPLVRKPFDIEYLEGVIARAAAVRWESDAVSDERDRSRRANLRAVFGAILSYVRDGGRFWMRSDRTSDGELVMTMRIADPDDLQSRISSRLARFVRWGRR